MRNKVTKEVREAGLATGFQNQPWLEDKIRLVEFVKEDERHDGPWTLGFPVGKHIWTGSHKYGIQTPRLLQCEQSSTPVSN